MVAFPGDIVGRLVGAAVRVAQPGVSEAHALVTLRDAELWLLPLRGQLVVDEAEVGEVRLCAGVEVTLARGVVLRVIRSAKPEDVLGLEVEGRPRVALQGPEWSLLRDGAIVPRALPRAVAHFFVSADGCLCRGSGQEQEVVEGWVDQLGGWTVRAVSIPLRDASVEPTFRGPPWRIVSMDGEVEVRPAGQRTARLTLRGVRALLVQVLGWRGEPTSWQEASSQVWRSERDEGKRLQNWWKQVKELRKQCAAADVPMDLITSDGRGAWRINAAVASWVDEME